MHLSCAAKSWASSMEKKTEVLRFRVGIDTVVALKRRCEETGESLSELMRRSIDSELVGQNRDVLGAGIDGNETGSSNGYVGGRKGRRHCAEVLSSILVRGRPKGPANSEEGHMKRHQIAHFIEMLLCALEFPADFDDGMVPSMKASRELTQADPIHSASDRARDRCAGSDPFLSGSCSLRRNRSVRDKRVLRISADGFCKLCCGLQYLEADSRASPGKLAAIGLRSILNEGAKVRWRFKRILSCFR